MSEYERRSPVSALRRGARCLRGPPPPPEHDTHTHTHTHKHSPPTHAHWALHFECRAGLLSLDVETRGSPPLPHHLVCVWTRSLPYLYLIPYLCTRGITAAHKKSHFTVMRPVFGDVLINFGEWYGLVQVKGLISQKLPLRKRRII